MAAVELDTKWAVAVHGRRMVWRWVRRLGWAVYSGRRVGVLCCGGVMGGEGGFSCFFRFLGECGVWRLEIGVSGWEGFIWGGESRGCF